MKKTIIAALLALVTLGASAQEAKTEYVFQPNWYIQLQGGAQLTLGEISEKDLISPNAQVAVGYDFTPVLGARLAVNAWQSRGGSNILGQTYKWKWNYVAPTVDLTVNLSNLCCGYNPKRVFNLSIFGGIGANIAFKNDEAQTVDQQMTAALATGDQTLRLLWDGTKTRFMGQAGVMADFRVSDRVKIGLEVSANTLGDAYNSKKAGNSDWYFNALAGVKIALGKTYTTREIPTPEPQIVYKDRIVEKIVEKPVEKKVVEKDPLRIDVFFTIASTKLVGSEEAKVKEIANYLNNNSDAKVNITGYADKGTGNAKINNDLSQKRAEIVKNELINKYGIAADRIVTDYKGDTVQPYDVDVLNRVSICIAK